MAVSLQNHVNSLSLPSCTDWTWILHFLRERATTENHCINSIDEIAPYIKAFTEKITDIVDSTTNATLNFTYLQFIETLIYYQVDIQLLLERDKESIQIDNPKTRDNELMKNSHLRENAKVDDLLSSLSDLAMVVLKRDGFGSKPSATVMKQFISYLIHIIIVYAKERISKLSTLIEVSIENGVFIRLSINSMIIFTSRVYWRRILLSLLLKRYLNP